MLVCVFGMSSCYDDDGLKGDIADLQVRVASLEAWQKNVNSDIESLKTIVEALQNKNFITSVSPLASATGDTGEKGDTGDTGAKGDSFFNLIMWMPVILNMLFSLLLTVRRLLCHGQTA